MHIRTLVEVCFDCALGFLLCNELCASVWRNSTLFIEKSVLLYNKLANKQTNKENCGNKTREEKERARLVPVKSMLSCNCGTVTVCPLSVVT